MSETTEPRPVGRPTRYKRGLANEICDRIALGETLRKICEEEEMPDRRTVFRWLEKHDEFRHQYTRSRELQQEHFADEILDIADDGQNDWMDTNIGPMVDKEAVLRSKLRVDTRKWLMGKVAPKKYGDRTAVEHSGPGGGPIEYLDQQRQADAELDEWEKENEPADEE
ncbi:MAG: terminase small subunit protein [Gemmatimonadetes bacterium]|nr:terminase small subunit protein [Gemmatimonadota bacterium]